MESTTISKAELKARTRTRLTEVALGLFEERGFDTTTAAQIAAAAGVIERTFFNHFPTKADVLFPRDESAMRMLYSEIVAQPSGTSDFEVLRECGIRWLLSAPRGDMALHRRIVKIRLRSYGSLSVVGRMVQLMAEFTSTMVAGVATRHGRQEPTLEERALGIAVAELLRIAWESWVAGNQADPFEEVADSYLSVIRREDAER